MSQKQRREAKQKYEKQKVIESMPELPNEPSSSSGKKKKAAAAKAKEQSRPEGLVGLSVKQKNRANHVFGRRPRACNAHCTGAATGASAMNTRMLLLLGRQLPSLCFHVAEPTRKSACRLPQICAGSRIAPEFLSQIYARVNAGSAHGIRLPNCSRTPEPAPDSTPESTRESTVVR